jgi:hypothetical protein
VATRVEDGPRSEEDDVSGLVSGFAGDVDDNTACGAALQHVANDCLSDAEDPLHVHCQHAVEHAVGHFMLAALVDQQSGHVDASVGCDAKG